MKKSYFLSVLAVILILFTVINSAFAYFTASVSAVGGKKVTLGGSSEIVEKFANWTKKVTITAKKDSELVYVRVTAFCGSAVKLEYSSESDKWFDGNDGYWYYSEPIKDGESTEELLIKINDVPVKPGEDVNFEEYNVAVIQEYTPVRYHEDGTPYGDWSDVSENGG